MASRREELGQKLPVPSAGEGEAAEPKQQAHTTIYPLNYQICRSLPSPHLKPQNQNQSSGLLKPVGQSFLNCLSVVMF